MENNLSVKEKLNYTHVQIPETYFNENEVSYLLGYLKKQKMKQGNQKIYIEKHADWDTEFEMDEDENFVFDDDGGYGPEEKLPYKEEVNPDHLAEEDIEYFDTDEEPE